MCSGGTYGGDGGYNSGRGGNNSRSIFKQKLTRNMQAGKKAFLEGTSSQTEMEFSVDKKEEESRKLIDEIASIEVKCRVTSADSKKIAQIIPD